MVKKATKKTKNPIREKMDEFNKKMDTIPNNLWTIAPTSIGLKKNLDPTADLYKIICDLKLKGALLDGRVSGSPYNHVYHNYRRWWDNYRAKKRKELKISGKKVFSHSDYLKEKNLLEKNEKKLKTLKKATDEIINEHAAAFVRCYNNMMKYAIVLQKISNFDNNSETSKHEEILKLFGHKGNPNSYSYSYRIIGTDEKYDVRNMNSSVHRMYSESFRIARLEKTIAARKARIEEYEKENG